MCFSVSAYAESITLPNGQELNITNLTDTEISQAIKTARKSMEGSTTDSVMQVVKGVDPKDLDAWGRLISGTIKTICNDLNVTVNEFVKTPVGLGVAGLIFYRVAGKDLMENALDLLIMVPLWFIMTGIVLFLGWYFFSAKTIWDITENEKGKIVKSNARRVKRYPWVEPTSNNDVPTQIIFGVILMILQVLGTIVTLMIVLS